MKKSLRRTPGAPKSYAEPEEDLEVNQNLEKLQQRERENSRESIF
jgi:hypothetical protein